MTNWGIRADGIAALTVKDCLFASITNIFSSNTSVAATFNHNAKYLCGVGWAGSDATNLAGSPFETGLQGSNYLGQSCALINAGSTNADKAGLFHYTTSTNNTLKETNSFVDIGCHYGAFSDTDGDGLPDCQEDVNGDGLYSSNSVDISNWQVADTDGDGLNDGFEYNTLLTDPKKGDTDGDGCSDHQEYVNGADPLLTNSFVTSISGTITYDPLLPGPIRIVAETPPPTNGLALFYSFETNRNPALDLSGNGHLGVVTGAEYIAYGPGGYYRFDGVDDCIRVTNSPWLQTSNFTISAWVQSFENVYTAERGVFGKHRTGANTHSYNMYHGVYKSLYARVWGSSGSMAQMTNITATVLEKWGLLTMTYTGSTARFYVNGIPAGSATTAGHAGNTYPLLIGATELSYSLTPRLFWKGLIDEVLVYNRALDPGEITNLYSYGPNFYINRQTPITQPGGYTLDNLPNNRSYTLTVYRDSNTNGVKDAGETYFTTNQLYLSQAMTGINFLVDPDSDADGVCDAPEIYYGTDPYDSNSFPVCISGEIAYSGRQTGAVHIVVSDDAGLVLNLPFDVNGEARTYDWSGAGHTSAVYGAISTNGGYVGGTYWFDGINDYVLAGSLGYISNGVISFWMYPDVLESCRNPFSTDYAGWDDCIRFEEYSWGQFVCGKLDASGMTYTMNLAASNWSHVVLGWNLTNL